MTGVTDQRGEKTEGNPGRQKTIGLFVLGVAVFAIAGISNIFRTEGAPSSDTAQLRLPEMNTAAAIQIAPLTEQPLKLKCEKAPSTTNENWREANFEETLTPIVGDERVHIRYGGCLLERSTAARLQIALSELREDFPAEKVRINSCYRRTADEERIRRTRGSNAAPIRVSPGTPVRLSHMAGTAVDLQLDALILTKVAPSDEASRQPLRHLPANQFEADKYRRFWEIMTNAGFYTIRPWRPAERFEDFEPLLEQWHFDSVLPRSHH